MSNTREKLSTTTIGLHWLLAAGMIGMLAFGLYLEDLPRSPDKAQLIGIHKTIGIVVLIAALVRLMWRRIDPYPDQVGSYTLREQRLSKIVHILLLIGTVLLPLSGIMMSLGGGYPVPVLGLFDIVPFGKNEFVANIGHIGHGLGVKILIAAIVLHIAGALKNHITDKDGTIGRMAGKRVEIADKA